MQKIRLNDEQLQQIIDGNFCDFDLEQIKTALNEIGDQDIDDYIEEKAKDEIQEMDTDDLISLFNNYCENNNYWDEMFTPMDEDSINDALANKSPYEIIRNYDGDFDINADYFRTNYNSELTSFSESEANDEIIEYYLDDLANYAIENELVCNELLNSKDALIEIIEGGSK